MGWCHVSVEFVAYAGQLKRPGLGTKCREALLPGEVPWGNGMVGRASGLGVVEQKVANSGETKLI